MHELLSHGQGSARSCSPDLGALPHADKIDDAAKVLSEKSYPFLKEIDWTSDVYGKLPTQNALDVLKAIDPHFEGKPCNATPLQGS